MAIIVEERFRGRSGDAFTSRQREYLVTATGADCPLDDTAAIDAAVEESPDEIEGSDGILPRTNATISEHIDDNRMGVAVQYGEAGGFSGVATTPTGTVEYEFNYQAPSVQIFQTLSRIGIYTPAGVVEVDEFHGAIGVQRNADGSKDVEGVTTAPGAVTNSWVFTTTGISSAYESLVENLMGCVNSLAFKGRPPGTVRFVTCQSQKSSASKTTIRFGVQYEPNATNITIGTGARAITVPEKRGHDYLWVYRDLEEAAQLKDTLPAPRAVIVDQVFRYADLNALGI